MGSNGAVVALPRSASRIQRWRIPGTSLGVV